MGPWLGRTLISARDAFIEASSRANEGNKYRCLEKLSPRAGSSEVECSLGMGEVGGSSPPQSTIPLSMLSDSWSRMI